MRAKEDSGAGDAAPMTSAPGTTARGLRVTTAAFACLLALPSASPASSGRPAAARQLGVNVEGTADWEPQQTWANVIRQGRRWSRPDAPNGSNPDNWVPHDENGEPLTDAGIVLMIDLPASAAGVHRLSFTGQAARIEFPNSQNVRLRNVSWDARSNRTTGEVVVGTWGTPPRCSDVWMVLTGTRRRPGAPIGSGVSDVRLLRPGHAEGELFNRDFLARLAPFGAIRFMQFQGEGGRGITGNLDVAWSDRARPGWYTAQNTNGAPLEHAILLCNQLRKDAWITIPLLASDDYVTKVAQLFRYGGDGRLPYTGPPGSPRDPTLNPRPAPPRPEFPPLAPGLAVFVEYNNENWNTIFPTTHYNYALAHDDVAPREWEPLTGYAVGDVRRSGGRRYLALKAGVSAPAGGPRATAGHAVDGTVRWLYVDTPPAARDPQRLASGTDNKWDVAWRRAAWRSLRVSQVFATVWREEMMTRARPVIAQFQATPWWFEHLLEYLQSTHGPGGLEGAAGLPMSRHFYGGATTLYVDLEEDSPLRRSDTLTLDQAFASMRRQLDGRCATWTKEWARIGRKFGLRILAYEGGPSLSINGHSDAVKRAAQSDPRMKELIADMFRQWFDVGGDLFNYYSLCTRWKGVGFFGLSEDIASEGTVKWQAVKQVLAGR